MHKPKVGVIYGSSASHPTPSLILVSQLKTFVRIDTVLISVADDTEEHDRRGLQKTSSTTMTYYALEPPNLSCVWHKLIWSGNE